MNAAAALAVAIELTTQLLKLQQTLATAQAEGRDLTKEELDAAAQDAQSSIDRLKEAASKL